MNKSKVWKIILFSAIAIIFIVTLCWSLSTEIMRRTNPEFALAKNHLKYSDEFEETYGKVKSIEQIGEIEEIEYQKERHVHCRVTTKTGETIECTVVILMDEIAMWASHWETEKTSDDSVPPK